MIVKKKTGSAQLKHYNPGDCPFFSFAFVLVKMEAPVWAQGAISGKTYTSKYQALFSIFRFGLPVFAFCIQAHTVICECSVNSVPEPFFEALNGHYDAILFVRKKKKPCFNNS
jgi:hypothetical protein